MKTIDILTENEKAVPIEERKGIDYARYVLNKNELYKYVAASYFSFFSVGYLFYKSFIIAMIIGLSSWKFKVLYEEYLGKKRRDQLLIQFKDLMYGISTGVNNGGNIKEALKNSRENLVRLYSEDGYIVKEIDYMIHAFDNAKMYESDILYDFANTGGNLQKVIMSTIEVIMDKMNIQREIKVIVAQKQMEGKIVAIMPIIVLAFLNLVSPSYLSPMYDTLAGKIIMTISLIGFITAVIWIFKIVNWK